MDYKPIQTCRGGGVVKRRILRGKKNPKEKSSRRGFFKMLKGHCHEIFDFRFFYESVSSKPLSIPIGPFQFFSKIRRDIRSSRCTTGVVDTGGGKNLQPEKF
jgi:hypothetical protein